MFGDRIAVRIGRMHNNKWHVASCVQWSPVDEGCEYPPCLSFTIDDAQAFMDELWACGLRPTEGTGSAGAMAATQAHLKDLQRLVFKEKK